jgi:hypothetical protein
MKIFAKGFKFLLKTELKINLEVCSLKHFQLRLNVLSNYRL